MKSTLLRPPSRPVAALCTLVLGSALTLSGCGSDDTGSSDDASPVSAAAEVPEIAAMVPDSVKESGVLSVGTATYPPAVILASEGDEPSGWDIETAKQVAAIMGLKAEFTVLPFDGIVPGLEADRFDVAVGEIAILPERTEVVSFVQNHVSTEAFLVKADSDTDSFASASDVCGMTLAVLLGSSELQEAQKIADECESSGADPVKVDTYKDQPTANLAVSQGRADATLSSASQAVYMADQSKGALKVADNEFGPEIPVGMAIAANDDSAAMAEAILAATQHLIDDGGLQEILDQYNGGLGGVDEAAIVPEPTA